MAFPSFKIKTANMAGALPNIGCHISEKGLIREKMWVFFILEPTRLLRARKPGSGSWARMDSRTGSHSFSILRSSAKGVAQMSKHLKSGY